MDIERNTDWTTSINSTTTPISINRNTILAVQANHEGPNNETTLSPSRHTADCRNNCLKFFMHTIIIWNSLPMEAIRAHTFAYFQSQLSKSAYRDRHCPHDILVKINVLGFVITCVQVLLICMQCWYLAKHGYNILFYVTYWKSLHYSKTLTITCEPEPNY